MLCREIIAVCSEIHMEHKHSVWAERTVCATVCERRWFIYLLLFYKRVAHKHTRIRSRCKNPAQGPTAIRFSQIHFY